MRPLRRSSSFAYLFLLSICVAFVRFIIPALEEAFTRNGHYGYRKMYFLPPDVSYNETTAFCDDDVFLVTLVMTRHENVVQRQAIRQSWGGVTRIAGKKIHHVFILAETDDLTLREAVKGEILTHRDIVVLNFRDSYLNLTFKTLQSLHLVKRYCPRVDYVLKADDDVFINYYSLTMFLLESPRRQYAVGHKYQKAMPIRWKKSKWYTSRKVYPARIYPPYLAGTAYLMSRDVAHQVHMRSHDVTFLPWEDVFVGLCLKKIKVVPQMDRRFDTHAVEFRRNVTCPIHRVFSIHHMEPRNITFIWNKYLEEDRDPRCSPYMELE
ncbi:beta-1,3-galactosyltransferase 5-like [Ptychodera flava]|uniref:beta-1,3-galactosyltransferase 5-like n=1 Tax=Ptychodera flava TaxID=63121 RepID=UPI003969DE76